MIYQRTGKVAVFDDKFDEVKDLLRALSYQRIPFVYYQDEGGKDLPTKPIDGIRIVILDLQLITEALISEDNIVAAIGSRLQRVVGENHCYVLLYWSEKEKKYQQALEDAFNTKLKLYRPILHLSLNKAEARSDPEKTFDYVSKRLASELEQIDALQAFFLWENIVGHSVSSLVTDFTNMVNRDDSWNDSLKFILDKLSIAYAGKLAAKSNYDKQKKLSDALLALNYALLDNIEREILTQINNVDGKKLFSLEGELEDSFSVKINSKLLTADGNENGLEPGSVFMLDKEFDQTIYETKERFSLWYNNENLSSQIREENKAKQQAQRDKGIEETNSKRKLIVKNYNVLLNDCLLDQAKGQLGDILENSIKIELNVSPLCDYAQEKLPCCRLLPGLMINEVHRHSLINNTSYNYISDVPIEYNSDKYYFVFDFRFLYSVKEILVRKRSSQLRIKHQLLADIQLKLGSHVNRAGVLYVPSSK